MDDVEVVAVLGLEPGEEGCCVVGQEFDDGAVVGRWAGVLLVMKATRRGWFSAKVRLPQKRAAPPPFDLRRTLLATLELLFEGLSPR